LTGDDDDDVHGEEIVHHALFTAQKHGAAKLPEMIEVLDGVIAQRCASARANVNVPGHESAWDWAVWGRTTYVLETALAFLKRLDGDPEAKDYLVKRFRREVIRGEETRKIPVDNSGD
jgi:hypothetical protein